MSAAPATTTRFDPRMTPERARALAERVHRGQRDAGGMPVIDHVRRVAAKVPRRARVVAWLHEVLEYSSVPEETLLANGLAAEELRALRLLTRNNDSHADTTYLAHIELLARAAGPGASDSPLRQARRSGGPGRPPRAPGRRMDAALRARATASEQDAVACRPHEAQLIQSGRCGTEVPARRWARIP